MKRRVNMKGRRINLDATILKYEKGLGLEDGYERWTDVVIDGWIVTDFLIKVTKEDGTIVCPYIKHRRGITFICEDDYVIVDGDGTKHVCGADKVFIRYEVLE